VERSGLLQSSVRITEPVVEWPPISMLGTSLGLALVALVAIWIPSLRVTRIDAVKALRHD
jgi:ABC-type antimicrobial peptide transport system permease subunit